MVGWAEAWLERAVLKEPNRLLLAVSGAGTVTNKLPFGDGKVKTESFVKNVNKFIAYQLAFVRLGHKVAIESKEPELRQAGN